MGFLKNGGRGQDEVGREEAEVLVVVGRGGRFLKNGQAIAVVVVGRGRTR